MSTQAIFYQSVVPVSVKRHGTAAVRTGVDYSFARATNAVPVTAVEFESAAREYAIVFAGKDDSIMPVVVLSAQQGDNRYVDSEGRWKARYVPAYVRRYPFVFSSSDDGARFTLCIDESFSGYNTEGRGERLFDSEGERTQYLNTVLNFQQEYQAHFRATQALCGKLRESGLLEPVEARFTGRGGKLHTLRGLLVVSRDKLRALTDEQLAAMARSGDLELIHLHLHSLHHVSAMGEFLNEEGSGPAADAAPAAQEPVPAGRPAEEPSPEPTSGGRKSGKSKSAH